MKQVAILGCGPTGMAVAAQLTIDGAQVSLCDTQDFSQRMEEIRSAGGITLEDDRGQVRTAMPHVLTNDFAQALQGAEQVVICVPAHRQEEMGEALLPHLRRGMAVLLSPGNLGSILLRRQWDRANDGEGVLLGELASNLWTCRADGPAKVKVVGGLGSPKRVCALPASETPQLQRAFEGLFSLTEATNLLEGVLNSPNVVLHLAGTLLNTARVEQRGAAFALFREGLSPAVLRCGQQVQEEREAVLQTLGLQIYGSTMDHIRKVYCYDQYPELETFRGLSGPDSLTHRYIREDASCGVALLVSLGKAYGVPVPMSETLLRLAGLLNGVDYLAEGRTLENLGLAGLTVEQLREKLA